MLAPAQVCVLILLIVNALDLAPKAPARLSVAWLVTAVLFTQSLRPTLLMRVLTSCTSVLARQGYRRVDRMLDRPWLQSAWLTPRLVRGALALLPPDGTPHLAMDSVRCRGWEVFTIGLVCERRVALLGWAVIPYPWEKGVFTPTVCRLVQQVAASWPVARRPHLLADRGFPSWLLLKTLRRVGWDYTVRVQAQTWLTDGTTHFRAAERMPATGTGVLSFFRAGFCKDGRKEWAHLLLARPVAEPPRHQRGPASRRRRAAQRVERERLLRQKHPGTDAVTTDTWVILFTTHPTATATLASYRRRWATEGTYRDGQGGWDGQHGWDAEDVIGRRQTAARVSAVLGLWALGSLIQTWVGTQITATTAPAAVAPVVAGWTTTGRLSVWARGRLALQDPSGRVAAWLPHILQEAATRIAAAPPVSTRVFPAFDADDLPDEELAADR